ncbi:MAG: hypothetical protein EA339_15495 [Rhodobacteraceae bacterium]|nr:MAG: hypothetical protein EA339_15495 [Paracoccaceae bacterium]
MRIGQKPSAPAGHPDTLDLASGDGLTSCNLHRIGPEGCAFLRKPWMKIDNPDAKGKGLAVFATALALALAACAPAPDLTEIRATFDAPPDLRPARVSADVARTGFGKQITRAVETHPQLAASSASVRAAQARSEAEGRGFLPQFAVSATLGSLVNGGLSGSGFSPALRVMQLVYDGGASASRQVAAQARVFESRGDRQEIAAALALDAVAAWYELRAARARASIAAENVRAHELAFAQVAARADAGAGGNADVLTAQARLATARARAADAAARVARSEAGFAASFGQRPAAALSAPPGAPQLPAQSDEMLIATSPRILGINAGIAAAQADVSVVQSQRFPRLRVDGAVQRGGSRATLDLDQDIGAPGNRQALIRAAQAQVDVMLAERENLAREIVRALSDLRSDQRAGAARVSAAREAVRANRATVEASREEFSIGRRSLLGLLDAERDLFDATESLIAAEREVALSGYAALALTGDILDVFAIMLPQPSGAALAAAGAEDD